MRCAVVVGMGLAVMVLAGCQSPVQSFTPMAQKASATQEVEKSYKLGEPQRAYIGAQMMRVQTYFMRAAEYAVPTVGFTLNPPIPVGSYSANPGIRYRIEGVAQVGGEEFYVIPLAAGGISPNAGGALVRKDGTIFHQPIIRGDIPPSTWTLEPPNARFEIKATRDVSGIGGEGNFELIYSGLSGNNIRVLYREYTGDNMARSAFTQELTYERGSKQIRFRNFLLRVDAVTNEEIRFTVVADQ